MTIFLDFDPLLLANGTPLDSLGFVDYPALTNPDPGTPIATDPNWIRTVSNVRHLTYTIGTQDRLGPRSLYDAGAPIVRLEFGLAGYIPGPPLISESLVVLAKDDRNFVRVNRYGLLGDGAQGLGFSIFKDGKAATGSDIFFGFLNVKPQAYVGEVLNFTFRVVNGTKLYIDIEGVEQALMGTSQHWIDIPVWLQGAQKVGYYDFFATNTYPAFRLRDNNDVIDIGQVDTLRHQFTDTSNLVIPVTCNIAGSTAVDVSVYDANNALIVGPMRVTLGGGAALVQVGPIPKDREQTLLKLTANNVGGASQTRTTRFYMPETPILQKTYIGNNDDMPYLNALCPWNDIAKHITWRITGHPTYTYIMHPDQDRTIWNNAGSFNLEAPADFVNMDRNGNPKKFPDNPAYNLSIQLSYTAEAGDYIVDMTEAPDLQFTLIGTSSAYWNFDLANRNFYGPNKHKLTINPGFKAHYYLLGELYFGMSLTRDASKPNGGMPSVPWKFQIVRDDADPLTVWSREYLRFCGGLGIKHQRYMSAVSAIEPTSGLPARLIPANALVRPSDQTYFRRKLPCHSAESIVQLHNFARWDIWYNFSRLLSDEAIIEMLSYFRDHLDPSLRIIATLSNEIWNTAGGYINAYIGYANTGKSKGLGLAMDVTGSVPINGTVLTVSVAGRLPLGPGHKAFIAPTKTRAGIKIATQLTSTEPGGAPGGRGTYQLAEAVPLGWTSSKILIDLAIPGTDMGTYGTGQINWVAGGTYVVGDIRSYNGVDFICQIAGVSNFTPLSGSDPDRWQTFQVNNLAKQRAYVEDMFRLRALMIGVFGSELAMKARCDLVFEGWDLAAFYSDPVPYLSWGDGTLRGMDIVSAFATGTYQDGTILNWANMNAAEQAFLLTNTGAARCSFWHDKLAANFEVKWRNYRNHKAELMGFLRGLGGTGYEVELWSYEGGHSLTMNLQGLVTAGADPGTLGDDIIDFHRNYYEDLYRNYYTKLAGQVGGRISHFTGIFPYFQISHTFFNNFNTFAMSGYTDDTETASRYRGLRAASLAFGGVVISPDPPIARRRPQPVLFKSKELA